MKEKKEEKVDLVSAEQMPLTTEGDAKRIINELSDICSAAQASFSLPPTTKIPRSANFYLEEVLRTLKEYNIIVE